MSPVVIRPAAVADYDRYLDAFEAVAAEGRWMGAEAPLDRQRRRPAFDQAVAGEDGTLLLAERDSEIVGAINAFGTGVVDIGMFVVDGNRGAGVGSTLLEAAIEWSRQRGAHKVSLAVWATNSPAQALYSKFGFRVEGRRRRHYRRRNGELWDSLIMGLLLDEDSGPALAVPEGGLVDGELTVRPWRRSDIPDLMAAVTDPDIAQWLDDIPQPYTADDASAFLALAGRGLTEGRAANLAVTLGGRLAGAVGLRLSAENPQLAEVGYWTAAAARRQGVATRATRLITAWAAEPGGARRIEIHAAVGNTPSRAVAEAAGFELEGVLRSWRTVHGQPTDFALYAVVPSSSKQRE